MFDQIDKVIGTKDYVNYRLTGRVATDYSYASGSGVYDLMEWDYSDKLLAAADLPRDVFPDIVPSTEIIGQLTPRAADALGLPVGTPVACGGVDNSCMALGARAMAEGRAYASLGSSMWIAVSSGRPLLNDTAKPYVFTHVVPGMFTSAVSIFSGGSSLRWVRDTLCKNLVEQARAENRDPYDLMTDLAGQSPIGREQTSLQPQSGRRFFTGTQCPHPRRAARSGSGPCPIRHHPRRLGGHRVELAFGARRASPVVPPRPTRWWSWAAAAAVAYGDRSSPTPWR